MTPPIQLTTETSTFETLYPIDSGASESAKLLRLARGYKSRAIDFGKIVNVNIYGYISTEAQMNSQTEKSERAAMRSRMNGVRESLIQMGVSNDKIWIGGVAFSSNWNGQINVSVRETNLNSIILPLYPPYVPSGDPPQSPAAREQWLDADGTLKKDVLKDVLAIEIELSLKENAIFRKKPPVSVKASIKSDGKIELGAELTALEAEIKKSAAWGTVQEIKFKVSVEGGAAMQFEDEKLHAELNAAVKAALSATLVVPGTSIKIPVEVSIGIAADGKVEPGLSVTYRW